MRTGQECLRSLRRFSQQCALAPILALAPVAAHGAPSSIRVVTDNNYPPYLFVGQDGKPQGYLVDLWKLWQQKTGIRVDLEPMQWSAAQTAMQQGRADVIDMIFHTPERDRLYRFSAPYSTQSVGIYVDHAIQGIRGPGSLRGFEIGVEQGDACIHALHSQGIRDLALYPNYEAIISAAKKGTIKMFCMDDDPANYYLYLSRDQLRFAKAFTLYTGHFHWAARRGDDAMYALVAQGMGRISPQERAELQRRWFTHPVQFRHYARLAAIVGLVVACLLAAALVWIGLLRRAVRVRTAELLEKNSALERRSSELVLQHTRLRTLIESSPDAIWVKDRDGVYVDCNARAAELAGIPREKFIGSKDEDLTRRVGLIAAIRASDQKVWTHGAEERSELTVKGRHGRVREVEVIRVPIAAPDGAISGVLGVARDITRRRRNEQEVRIAAVAFESQDGIVVSDARDVFERVNSAFTQLTGYALKDVCGRTVSSALRSGAHSEQFYSQVDAALACEGNWRGPIWCRKKDGSRVYMHVVVSAVRDDRGKVLHFVRTFHDLTEEIRAKEHAERLANFDPLTNLLNRGALEQRLTQALVAAGEDSHTCGALLLVGLDDFALINNIHGHSVGNDVLLEASRRIRAFLATGDTLARLGGDMFAFHVACQERAPVDAAELVGQLAYDIRSALGEPYVFEGIAAMTCTASIGVTLLAGPVRSADALLNEAEIAMYKAKSAGKNAVRLFESDMQKELDARMRLAGELRAGIGSEQFLLYYQPQVDASGRIKGAEALLRWKHPIRGMVSPMEFIPVAEQTGLIDALGGWAIRQACRQLARWANMPDGQDIVLSVNVSARQFRQADFVRFIEDALTQAGADPAHLELEITESLVMDDIDDAVRKLQALKADGVHVSLDDFGTGSSSLSYLTRLPLDQIKIDKSFVGNLPHPGNEALITQAILAMANGMGLEVVAEGVETAAQFEFLKAHGCHLYQGYLFARPMPCEAFEASFGKAFTL